MEMDNKTESQLPKRKELRLKQYDYSSQGAYFVTICIEGRKPILSDIITPVGVGALDDPQIRLTEIGKTVEKHLLSSEKISGVTIDQYVIMPDHLHVMIFLDPNQYTSQKTGRRGRRPLPMQ
jgi:REP element-mobilizing transposase RayT